MKLFVKSWINDFQWLKQAMISVHKTCLEPVDWTICVDDGTTGQFDQVIAQVHQESGDKSSYRSCQTFETSSLWSDSLKIQNGYLRQQWIKMNSHRAFPENDVFWIWDSDLIAMRPFSSRDFTNSDGKPIYWFTQFNSILGGRDDGAHLGRIQMIKEIFNIREVPFEWMRCIPIPQFAGILRHAAGTSYWNDAFNMLVKGDERFSEFNVIGQFAHQYFPDAFDWRNTHNYPGKTFSGPMGDKNFIVSQGHSWSGMPSAVSDYVKTL